MLTLISHAWNGSWNGGAESPSGLGAVVAVSCGIGAGSGVAAREHASCNRLVGVTTGEADTQQSVAAAQLAMAESVDVSLARGVGCSWVYRFRECRRGEVPVRWQGQRTGTRADRRQSSCRPGR